MKKARFLIIVTLLALLLSLSGCASLLDALFNEVSEAPVVKSGNDPLDGYVFAYCEGLSGTYHVAKITKPASPSTKNQAEVLDMSGNNGKRWTEVFTTHPATKSELSVGEVVLYQGSGFSDPDKETLIATSWDAYYITDTSDLFKDEVTLRGDLKVSVKHLRIPDTEIITN